MTQQYTDKIMALASKYAAAYDTDGDLIGQQVERQAKSELLAAVTEQAEALRIAQAELEEWRFTNKIDELQRENADLALLADQYKAERDTARAEIAAMQSGDFYGLPFPEAKKRILELNEVDAKGIAISLMIQLNTMKPLAAGAAPQQEPTETEVCNYCTHPLYAGTKCKNCGRVTDTNPPSQVNQKLVEALERIVGLCDVGSRCTCGRPNGLPAVIACASAALAAAQEAQ